jgi:hypothetical protein
VARVRPGGDVPISSNSDITSRITVLPVTNPNRVFDFYLLEDRILLSADGPDAGEMAPSADVEYLDSLMAQMLEAGPTGAADDGLDVPLTESIDAQSIEEVSREVVDAPVFEMSRPLEVVFVDAGVGDSETLLSGLRDDTVDGTQWMVVYLSGDQDGIEQITRALAEVSGVDAIHLLSHGDGEGIQLGSTRLDQQSASGYAGQIATWQEALDTDADLLIYGCELASTDEGRTLIEMLSHLCDCDVAASDDATGHESIGGDWDLEYTVGLVESSVAF